MDTPEAIANTYLQRHVSIDIGSALSRGWALLQANMGVLIGALIVIVVGGGLLFATGTIGSKSSTVKLELPKITTGTK